MKILNITFLDDTEDCEQDIESTRDLRAAMAKSSKGRELFQDQPCLKFTIKLNKEYLRHAAQ